MLERLVQIFHRRALLITNHLTVRRVRLGSQQRTTCLADLPLHLGEAGLLDTVVQWRRSEVLQRLVRLVLE